ncbi:cytidylyltransferase domain-containing protein [Psychromonas aquatilis]|uniref:Acylneuraminate cytidylyltransferase family protein n=1 Tax=Psychromonas aquatilis TaxID=2005072 RepID=A0ABU9GT25_9GAMM
MIKNVAFVPIKMNNERLPGKNTKEFDNGKPLISYILNSLLKAEHIDEIYVYCSTEKVKGFLPEGVKFLKRSANLDLDSTKINEVMTAFANDVPASNYILTHATAPFISVNSINSAVKAVSEEGFDSALTVEAKQDFLWLDNKPHNYDVCTIPRTQDLSPFFIETTGLYVYTQDLVKQNRRIGDKPFLVSVSKIEAIDINEPIDFEIANAIAASLDI